MDLVPRIDGEQVDGDMCSITRLHRVHMDSAQISCATKVCIYQTGSLGHVNELKDKIYQC